MTDPTFQAGVTALRFEWKQLNPQQRREQVNRLIEPGCSIRGVSKFTINEDGPRVGLAIFPDYTYELPAVTDSAILYEVDPFMTIPTVHVLRAPSICEMGDARDFSDQ